MRLGLARGFVTQLDTPPVPVPAVGDARRAVGFVVVDRTSAELVPMTSPRELMAAFAGEPNRGAPSDMAVFVKTRGERDR